MKALENMSAPLIFLLWFRIFTGDTLWKAKEGIGSLCQTQVRFVASLDSKKFVSFCIYSLGFYQLSKPVCLIHRECVICDQHLILQAIKK